MLAQQQQDTISVGETLLIASVPAAIALIGVIVTVVLAERRAAETARRERHERQVDRIHQAQLERDRVLRSERISLYRRVIDAASNMLFESAQAAVPDEGEPGVWADTSHGFWPAYRAWQAVLAEARFLAAEPVVQASLKVELVKRRRVLEATVRAYRAGQSESNEDEEDDDTERYEALTDENEALLLALIEACSRDIKALTEATEPDRALPP